MAISKHSHDGISGTEDTSDTTQQANERATVSASEVLAGNAPVTTDDLPVGGGYDVPTMLYTAARISPGEWLDGENILISAGTAWNNPPEGDGFTISVPEADTLFIDSGGYQSVKYWGGDYPYTPKELFDWAESVDADYVAGMDTLCLRTETLADMTDRSEDEIATIPERIERTIDKQIEQYEVYKRHDYSFDLVPVVQGFTPEDYQYCAHRLKQAGLPLAFVTIGSTGKRDQYNQEKTARILEACHEELPRSDFHLLGAGKAHWENPRLWGLFDTCDTHGWAATMPEGGFPQSKAEEEIAFESYSDALADARQKIESHERSGFSEVETPAGLMLELSKEWDRECLCGAEIPRYGDDFEPQCRRCERIQINRWDHNLARSEQLSKPTPQTKQTDLSSF